MQIETYELEDMAAAELHEDVNNPEALRLIAELGLGGQEKLLAQADETAEQGRRSPYRRMTAEEAAVYALCFPLTIPLEKYEAGPIPVRVLQVAADARSFYPSLYVWAPEDASFADPLLAGYLEPPAFAGGGPRGHPHILARWGSTLLPFDELRAKAAGLLERRWRIAARRVKAALESLEASLPEHVQNHITTGKSLGWNTDPTGILGSSGGTW